MHDVRPGVPVTPRKADTSKVLPTSARNVHEDDVLIGTDGLRYRVTGVQRTLWLRYLVVQPIMPDGTYVQDHLRYTVDVDRDVQVQMEHECTCDGSGIYYISGGTVNGVFVGQTGKCFGCHGKGWQDRSDVIRNRTYWSKYARVGA